MEKIILDSDMIEGFDDGVAMILLANAPNVKLLGVTTVTGNSWAGEGAAFAIRQLEIEGFKNVPVAQGATYPLREGRMENIMKERQTFGIGIDPWEGAFTYPAPKDWVSFYRKQYNKKPSFSIEKKPAVDFIIDTIKQHPGEITFIEIGPATNLALALKKDPSISKLIKRVIYMGGAFFVPGNVMPAAEFNFWFDPEAAKIAVNTPFKEQTIVSLDVCNKVHFKKEIFDAIIKMLGKSELVPLFERSYHGVEFAKNPQRISYIWDIITAAIIIDPSIIKAQETLRVDINADYGLSYGQSLAYKTQAPKGAQNANIILDIDEEKLWALILNKKFWRSAKQ